MILPPFFCQADKRWAHKILGRNRNFQQSGCLVTSSAMWISWRLGKEITPAELDNYLDTHKGYDGDAMLWNKIPECLAVHNIKVSNVEFFAAHDIASIEWKENNYPILQVRYVSNGDEHHHFVLLLNKDGHIHDPASSNGANIDIKKTKYQPVRVAWWS